MKMGEAAQPRTVLLVDDDEDICEIVAEVVAGQGYVVQVARNGREALAALERGGELPSLVLLDMMMPELDGPQLLTIMKETPAYADIPVVMVTAARREPPRNWGSDVSGWLFKPVDYEQLVGAIARFAGRTASPTRSPVDSRRVDRFIERRRREIQILRDALAGGDHEEIRRIGHNLKGVGSSFGFPELTGLGGQLESAARGADDRSVDVVIDQLVAYLARIDASATPAA
jgi:two-component system chemotaxis response regulator CheY